MVLEHIAARIRRRAFRREYRAMVAQWYADGGDARFRFDYDLDAGSVVLDLGGYEGQWASDLYARSPCRIFVFEPVNEFAEGITARFRRNPDIDVLPFGLGASSRTDTIYVRGAGSSTYRKRARAEQIRIVDARQWFADSGLERAALAKINTEGGEYELLERLIESGLIENIDNIQVQFHNVAADSAARMERIQSALARTHAPTYRYRFVWENWTRNGRV